jgi:hypothetical protein
LQHRILILRVHNIEYLYYRQLAKASKSMWRSLYFYMESLKLKRLEQKPLPVQYLLCINNEEKENLKIYNTHTVAKHIPAYHLYTDALPQILTGKGNYCLYHGNLSVAENSSIAEWLIVHVAPHINLPLYIAGKDAYRLHHIAANNANVKIINNPSDSELEQLIQHAHINVLPTMQGTGMKLKLLHALHSGRFCVTNTTMLQGTGLHNIVNTVNELNELVTCINSLINYNFTQQQKQQRMVQLNQILNYQEYTQYIISLL